MRDSCHGIIPMMTMTIPFSNPCTTASMVRPYIEIHAHAAMTLWHTKVVASSSSCARNISSKCCNACEECVCIT